MIVGYARVSTTATTQDISIEGQAKQLKAAGCDRVISERASAYKGGRTGWEELWALVAGGAVSEVLVIDQSRMSRSGDDLDFLNACAQQGVTVRALSGGIIESETYQGFVMSGFQSLMNQADSKLKSVKVKEGIKRRRESGHYASGRVPFGYAYIDGRVVPHPDDWPVARQMFLDLLDHGMNVSAYVRANRIGWTTTGVKQWVVKPMLRGVVPHQEGGVKPLITPEEWGSASRLLEHRSRMRTSSNRTTYLLTGLVRCQCCGKNMKHKMPRYGTQRLYCANAACDWHGKGIKVSIVREQLIDALRSKAEAIQAGAQQASAIADSPIDEAQTKVLAEIAQLEQLQASGVASLDVALDNLKSRLAELRRPTVGPDWAGLAELISAPGVLDRFTDEQLRPLALEYVAQIVYVGNTREVEIRILKGVG